tara:strand:+ start:10390 stop:10653 length:264 start_codon:yes stop_codon:yes gene_type:complete
MKSFNSYRETRTITTLTTTSNTNHSIAFRSAQRSMRLKNPAERISRINATFPSELFTPRLNAAYQNDLSEMRLVSSAVATISLTTTS